jgi:hypothetical protein
MYVNALVRRRLDSLDMRDGSEFNV